MLSTCEYISEIKMHSRLLFSRLFVCLFATIVEWCWWCFCCCYCWLFFPFACTAFLFYFFLANSVVRLRWYNLTTIDKLVFTNQTLIPLPAGWWCVFVFSSAIIVLQWWFFSISLSFSLSPSLVFSSIQFGFFVSRYWKILSGCRLPCFPNVLRNERTLFRF